MSTAQELSQDLFNAWANDPSGPVALHLKQELISVEGRGEVIFPPTYADIGYCVDTLSDGAKVATIDSVGSQGNRMEALFKREQYSKLVPQVEILVGDSKASKDGDRFTISILDLPHRAGDAVVRACPALAPQFEKAFNKLARGDAVPLARLAPTSLVFGVWNSRGTGEKVPRLVRSTIRAMGVDVLHSAAQYNAIWKGLSDEDKAFLLAEEGKKGRKELADVGLKDVPSSFRKLSQGASRGIPQFRDGKPNDEARVLGGVRADSVLRSTTINLIALRSLGGPDDESGKKLRRYILGLALLAATTEADLNLRQGCLLKFADDDDRWEVVPRRGGSSTAMLGSTEGHKVIMEFAQRAADEFVVSSVEGGPFKFDRNVAAQLLVKKKGEDEDTPAS